jgi:hypothetical protein
MQMRDSWQLIIVGGIVLLAVAYLIRRSVRSWRMTGRGCSGSCGCAAKTSEGRKRLSSFLRIKLPCGE